MSDPAIKLFGKTIPLPELTEPQNQNLVRSSSDDSGLGDCQSEKEEKDNECGEETLSNDESNNVATTTEKSETTKDVKETNEESEKGTCSEEGKLKKPDKIIPCPRCNSMETKFCYYNNYNVNQPRHFCKKCQRYWTAGGTMRNVPVGAGRRKNKNPASHYNRSVAEKATVVADPNGTNLLAFGSDSVICESMASGLNIAEQKEGLKVTVPLKMSSEEAGTVSPLPCFPGPPTWPYAWNGVSWTVLPFYPPPPAYWTCPGVSPGTWNGFTWVPQPNSPSVSCPNSPTLGKHSREESVAERGATLEETESSKPERCLWVPKTLRIDDPEEAAKSSIWETLGIKKDEKADTFGAFRSSNKEKNSPKKLPGRRMELQANPAALSRSANFHESS